MGLGSCYWGGGEAFLNDIGVKSRWAGLGLLTFPPPIYSAGGVGMLEGVPSSLLV